MMKHPFESARAWVNINLSALERNLKSIRSSLPNHLKFISVVKANAYGHGLEPTVTRLMHSSADAFAVANLEEAKQIQRVGKGWPVLLLSPLLTDEVEDAIKNGMTPVVSSSQELLNIQNVAAKIGREVSVHLKIDTGMGRLGTWWESIDSLNEVIKSSRNVRISGLCTHFASADSDPPFTETQRDRFLSALNHLQPILPNAGSSLLIHADNSAGLNSFPENGAFNAARIGLLQFGVRPRPSSLLSKLIVDPVLSFHTRIGLIKELPADTSISYGQSYKLRKPSRIAILTAGYADGIPRSIGKTNASKIDAKNPSGSVIIHDTICPIIGRVTMDQTIVDVTHITSNIKHGDVATLIGNTESKSISLSEFAKSTNLIEWEALCGISARTQRLFTSDSIT